MDLLRPAGCEHYGADHTEAYRCRRNLCPDHFANGTGDGFWGAGKRSLHGGIPSRAPAQQPTHLWGPHDRPGMRARGRCQRRYRVGHGQRILGACHGFWSAAPPEPKFIARALHFLCIRVWPRLPIRSLLLGAAATFYFRQASPFPPTHSMRLSSSPFFSISGHLMLRST